MSGIRSVGRETTLFIFGITMILASVSGASPRPLQGPAQNQISGVTQTIAGRSQTMLPDGSILIAGGIESAKVTNTARLENSQTGANIQGVGSLLYARAFHSATLLPDGSVLVFGGIGQDSSLTRHSEIYIPRNQSFMPIATIGLTPRAHHTATLLTDGRVLIAGGVDSVGHTLSRIELWDFRSGQVSTLTVRMNTARSDQTATLLPDGSVLLWGGRDENGVPLSDGEIVDPQGPTVRLVSRPGGDLSKPQSPFLEASTPQNGETNVATNQIIALRFSKPLVTTSIISGSISLRSPGGDVQFNVVPAEGGILAFISRTDGWDTGTTYTLTISGPRDTAGNVLHETTIVFTTSDVAADVPVGLGGIPIQDAPSTPVGSGAGSADKNGPSPSVQKFPMLKAPNGVSALAGQVMTLDRLPLPKVRIEIGSHSAITDQSGRFLIQEVGSGHHVMIVDGTTANSKANSYGLFRVGVDLKAGRTNSLNYTIWMTALDTENEVAITSPTASDTIITNPKVPGLEVHIPAGTVIRDVHGKKVTKIGITQIPVNQPPFPMKGGNQYPVYFTIQPGGATIDRQNEVRSSSIANRRAGVTIHYRNYLGAKPGTRFPFWTYDPEQKGWYVYGHGKVSSDAKDIVPEDGTQITSLDGAMFAPPPISDPNGPKPCLSASPSPCNPKPTDPVDLQTGLFVYRKTDLTLNDVIPLVLTRVYRPNDSNSRAFGVGTSMSFDNFMDGDNDSTLEGYTYADLNLEDGGKIHFTRTSPCLGYQGYCDFDNALYEATSAPGEFYGATLQFFPNGGDNLLGGFNPSSGCGSPDYWQITTKHGMVYQFPDSDGATNPRFAAIAAIRDRNGNALSFTRDNNCNLIQVASPNGRWIQFTYDSSDRVVQAQDNSGRTMSYTYNQAGYLETATDANSGVTTYTYDGNGNMTGIRDPRSIVYLQNQYDANGMVSLQTLADGGTFTFSYTLDSNSNVTQSNVTDPRGFVEQVNFNADGFMTSDTHALGQPEQQITTYDPQSGTGLLLSEADPLSRTTSYSYDAMGDVTSITQLSGTSSATTTTLGYDQRYYEISNITDPIGNATSFTYDALGNMLSVTDPVGNAATFTYNSAGQPTTETDALGNQTQLGYDSGNLVSVTDPLGRAGSRYVDNAGRVVSVTDPLGAQTSIAYDVLNQITSTTDPMGNQTVFGYDGNGNLLSVTDANSNATSYTYDSMDRPNKRTDALGNFETAQYDLNGNVVQHTDRKGQVTTAFYDGLNRSTFVGYGTQSGPTYQGTVSYTLDAGNRATSIVDSQSGTISRSFDSFDRLLSETTPQGSVSYTYDADGRRQTMTVSGQSQVSYTFDNASRLTAINQGTAQVSFGYDASGRRTTLTLPNGVAANYSYDAASQLTGIVYQGGALAPANLSYTYDLAGRRTSVSGTLASTQLPAAISSAIYNADNQLTQWGATSMSYDLNGSTLNDGTNTYAWDARNRLVSANSSGATFAYDPLGRRTSRTLLSANTGFVYDGANPVQELNGSTVTANLLTGGLDEYFTRTDAGGTADYLTDALGSTIALTDASGNSVVQYSYGPYGSINITGTTNNTFTYTGREIDGLGVDYYRARYYNPDIGRFLSEDLIGFRGGINKYAYVANDPISFIDPFGLDKKPGGCDNSSCPPPPLPHLDLPHIPKLHAGCGSAIAETGLGVVTTGALVAGIWFAGPEFLAIAGEGVAETVASEGVVAGIIDIAHTGSAVLPVLAMPVTMLGNGVVNVAENCF